MSDNNGNGPDNDDPKKTPTENPKESPKIPPRIHPVINPLPNNPPPLPGGHKTNPFDKFTKDVGEQVAKRLLVEGIVDSVKFALRKSGGVLTEAVFQTVKESEAATDLIATAQRLKITVEDVHSLMKGAEIVGMDKEILFDAVETLHQKRQLALEKDTQAMASFLAHGFTEKQLIDLKPDDMLKGILFNLYPEKINKTNLSAASVLLGDQFEPLSKYFNRKLPQHINAFRESGLAIDYVTARNVARIDEAKDTIVDYGKSAYNTAKGFAVYKYNSFMDDARSVKAHASAGFSKFLTTVLSGLVNISDGAGIVLTEQAAKKSAYADVANEGFVVSLGEGGGKQDFWVGGGKLESHQSAQTGRENKEQARLAEETRAAEEAQAAALEAEVAARRVQAYSQLNLTDSSANSISSNLAPQLLDTQTAMLEELRELSRAVERNTQVIDQVLGSQ